MFVFRHFQIPFDTGQFTAIPEMVDLISDVLEERNKDEINGNYIEWKSTGTFLRSIIKKNKILAKVKIMNCQTILYHQVIKYTSNITFSFMCFMIS